MLQEKWDRQWSKSGNVVLILCGSYVGFMEREVLGRRSPLFGRRTAQILLRPFGFREAAEFHPGLRDDGWTDLGECKWGAVPSPRRIERELEEKAAAFPNPRNATLGRRIFARRRPASVPRDSGVRWYGLEEIYDSPG